MSKLIEWLDLGPIISGISHMAFGALCLAAVSTALISAVETRTPLLLAEQALTGPATAPRSLPATPVSAKTSSKATSETVVPGVQFVSASELSAPLIRLQEKALEAERRCLAAGIYFEARGESTMGQIAVAEVILNRVESGEYPDSICGVVYQGAKRHNDCQFSFACDGKVEVPHNRLAWRKSQRLARYIMSGQLRREIVGQSLFYHADYVRPAWSQHMVEVAKVGKHIFYRKRERS